jgi:hypothetical protein
MARTAEKRSAPNARIYDGDGDHLMVDRQTEERIVLLPDTRQTKLPERERKVRIMWGQHLLEDLLAGRYATLVCAVNAQDNSRGIIAQLAALLPTSQWDHGSITAHAKLFVQPQKVGVVKFDLDAVEVLALLRPSGRDHLRMDDLAQGFAIASEMIARKSTRKPCASVCFLGARANQLRDANGGEPSFETVLRTMYEAGYDGDVYPAPWMWESTPTAMFARYPFPRSLTQMREGGF